MALKFLPNDTPDRLCLAVDFATRGRSEELCLLNIVQPVYVHVYNYYIITMSHNYPNYNIVKLLTLRENTPQS